MTTELVQLSLKGPIATIVLNRADKLNALNAEMLHALEAFADELTVARTCALYCSRALAKHSASAPTSSSGAI